VKIRRKNYSELLFEDDETIFKSTEIIRKEFLKKIARSLGLIGFIVTGYIIYLIISYQPELIGIQGLINNINRSFYSNLTIGWIIFSTTAFLIVYLIKLMRLKITPSLISFIERESNHIGFELKKRFDSVLLFLLLNSISISTLIYMDLGVIPIENSPYTALFLISFSVYLILSLVLPIVWAIVNDKFLIKLKEDFYILFDFQFKIRKTSQEDSNLIGIRLTSNRLSSKYDRCGKMTYSKISQRRWLSTAQASKLNPYLHFQEFSTPLNFQKQFLNIALALNEWQNYYRSRILCFNPKAPGFRLEDKRKEWDYLKFFGYIR
jgi:hypothetical protein